jgi:hypothetical protein
LEGARFCACLVQKALPDGSADVATVQRREPRYARMTRSTRLIFAKPENRLEVRLPFALPIGAKAFDCDVNCDLVPVLEAVGNGLLRRINSNRYAINADDLKTGTERGFRIPKTRTGMPSIFGI